MKNQYNCRKCVISKCTIIECLEIVQDTDSAVNLSRCFALLINLNLPEAADVDNLTNFYALTSGR